MDNCMIYRTYSRSFPDRELRTKCHANNAVLYILLNPKLDIPKNYIPITYILKYIFS